MIIAEKYPYLKVKIGESIKIDAYVDTGYAGFLFIPEEYKDTFDEPDSYTVIILAGGVEDLAPIYIVKVEIDGIERTGFVICYGTGSYLIGRRFIDEFKVCFDKGKKLIIEDSDGRVLK